MWVSTGAIGICALIFIIAIYSCMVKHAAANSIALFAVMFQDLQTLTSSCNFTRDMLHSFLLLQIVLLNAVLPWGTCQSGMDAHWHTCTSACMNKLIFLYWCADENVIVQCRTTTDCTGNFSLLTKRQCCVESTDGLAFTVNGEATCHVCIGKML